MTASRPCALFAGPRLVVRGPLAEVALAAKAIAADDAIVVFDEEAGTAIDLDLSGDDAAILGRLAARGDAGADQTQPADTDRPRPGRGRPKLGVIAREVTLLPRHWQWLAAQPGGASPALRRLVDEARRADRGRTAARARRERAYAFMAVIAGDLPGFEEAARALFADDRGRFCGCIAGWPPDVAAYARQLAFDGEADG